MAVDWSVFDGFTPPRARQPASWAALNSWVSSLEHSLGISRATLLERRRRWDALLADLGGDPTSRDWTSFRPLRRDREEDWSDWLAQLFDDSRAGIFAWALLSHCEGRSKWADYRARTVHREVTHERYRADLIVEWHDATYTHIEVKVGDEMLAKTLPTSLNMESRFHTLRRRSDILLVLPQQVPAWNSACRCDEHLRSRVHALTWTDLARALRQALLHGDREPVHWRVWAFAFCGAVEQDLLGLRPGQSPEHWVEALGLWGVSTATAVLDDTRLPDDESNERA